jgi:iron complex outermembrane receptor protein
MLHLACLVIASSIAVSSVSPASVDEPPPQQGVPPVTLPPVVVTAQKEPADAQRLPVSVSAVNRQTLDSMGATSVGEASIFSPNTLFAELSARKVSNPYIRGIGSSPSNPGVTTYIDGVPQLNANSANVELIDIEQVEFVRGAQSALFGRNALGGLINVTTARPSMTQWTSRIDSPLGTQRELGIRGSMSGPLSGNSAIGLAFGTRVRDGFTVNDVSGNTLDDRSATFGRAQFVYMPTPRWETRFIFGGERDRDGDYALNDLDETRRNPYHAQRDVEGFTDRDIWSSTILIRHEGPRFAFTSTSGGVWWETHDFTDLDYSAMPLMTRDNAEKDTQFTQEFRVASAARAPARLSRNFAVEWQAGVMLFSQHYTQDAVTTFAPYVLSPSIPVSVSQNSPAAVLDDKGLGLYAMGTLTAWSELDLTLGARFDREQRKADIGTSYDPAIAPPTQLNAERTFSDVSPQAALAWRATSGFSLYTSIGKGFKAGGFNTWAPPGSESYGEEQAWNLEAGVKTTWAQGRLLVNASYYRIDWDDMQLNVPTPGAPAQFYIANVGNAKSSGFELAMNARPASALDFYGTFGTADATFGSGSTSGGVDVSGNDLPLAPGYTASLGAKLSAGLGRSLGAYGRADVVFYGAYHYDDQNRAGQDAYSVVNLRGGFRVGKFGVEAWVRNAFDTRYVPLAFAYGSLTPSGFIAEPGAPRVVGITARVGF